MMTHPQIERHATRFYGLYSAEVTAVEDEAKRGWITVKVPAVFGIDLQVRARPCFPYGHHYVPPVGAHVWIQFEAGDTNYPLWLGVWYPPDEMSEAVVDPPTNRVIETESGHRIELDDTEDAQRIAVTHASGTKIEIDNDGNVTVAVEGDVTIESKGAVTVQADGDVTIDSGGAVNVTGSEINLN